MKIGIDCRLWNQTGVGRYIRNLVKGLDESNSPHTYVLYLLHDEYKNLIFKSSKIEKRLADIRWHSLQEQFLLPRIIAKDHLDLMHFTYYSVPLLYKSPYVITLHDLIIYHFMTGEASTLPLPLYRAKHLAYRFLLSQMRRNAKQIIVPLESTKADVIKLFPQVKDKITVTREGFDNSIATEGTLTAPVTQLLKKRYLMYVGNAYPHKNVVKLLDAFLQFKNSHPESNKNEVELVMVGKDDFFYKRLKLQYSDPTVHFVHDISDYELGELYKNAVALVAPSLMEGFGLPVLEAMSLGCIVAASDIPSFKEVCGDTALFFNPKDAQDISRAMQEVSQFSNSKRTALTQKGKDRAKSFSWDIMVQQTIAVYESSLSVRSGK